MNRLAQGVAAALCLAPAAAFAELSAARSMRPAPWAEDLDRTAREVRRRLRGELFMYVSDPASGFAAGFNDKTPTYLASGVKIAFMTAAFDARERGRLSFEEKVVFGPGDVRDGGPRTNALRAGQTVTVGELVEWMMRWSDNAATDLIGRRVGLDRVNAVLPEYGLEGFSPLTFMIDVRRGFYREVDPRGAELTAQEVRTLRWTPVWEPQIRAFTRLVKKPPGTYSKADLLAAYDRYYATGVNSAPMAAVGLFFEKMLRGELVSPEVSREMIELMSGARTSTNRLLGKLPRGTRVAHKTGSQFKRMCDLGIIHLPDASAIVAAVCTSGAGVRESEAAIATVARRAYDLVWASRRAGPEAKP